MSTEYKKAAHIPDKNVLFLLIKLVEVKKMLQAIPGPVSTSTTDRAPS